MAESRYVLLGKSRVNELPILGLLHKAMKIALSFAIARWVRDLVSAGRLGHKTGRGIHDYSSGPPRLDLDDVPDPEKLAMRDLVVVQINEAAKLIDAGILDDPVNIDLAIMTGTGNKAGIFGLLAADRHGVIHRLDQLAALYGMNLFRPAALLDTMPVPDVRKALREWKRKKKQFNS